MQTFFDRSNLTDEQRARWDAAIAEYHRIQEENLMRKVSAMSEADKAAYLMPIRSRDPSASDDVLEHMRAEGHPAGVAAGDAQSALFARLLAGKKPLAHPPPTSNSYPWYAVVEEDGPFPVVLGNMMFLGAAPGHWVVSLNQCPWTVLSSNEAAKELISLNKRLAATVTTAPTMSAEDRRVVATRRYRWDETLRSDVIAAYAGQPEFLVRHGQWPTYRLYVGRHEISGPRAFAEDAMAGRHLEKLLENTSSVFDMESLCLNAVLAPEGDHAQLQFDGWMLRPL